MLFVRVGSLTFDRNTHIPKKVGITLVNLLLANLFFRQLMKMRESQRMMCGINHMDITRDVPMSDTVALSF